MNEEEVELFSLVDLDKISREKNKWGFEIVLIGGYAVRAYTIHWRVTKDLDFVTKRNYINPLKNFFKNNGYSVVDRGFGFKGSKKLNGRSVELDVSVDRVEDETTGNVYTITDDVFERCQRKRITSYNSEIEVEADVIAIEDLFILKMMTEREKDEFDASSIILDSSEIDLDLLVHKIKENNLERYFASKLERMELKIKNGKMDRMWGNYARIRLTIAQRNKIRGGFQEIWKIITGR
ncbi:MAG: nucleotidyl transferase AbiEii/AbiGii toxin family protein [Candidatus Syntropharchaeia archaeon]